MNGYELLVDRSMQYAIYYQNRISVSLHLFSSMNRYGSTIRSIQTILIAIIRKHTKVVMTIHLYYG